MSDEQKVAVDLLEDSEYSTALLALVDMPEWQTVITRWLAEYHFDPREPVTEAGRDRFNFRLGSAKPMREYMEGLELTRPDVYSAIQQHVRNFNERRRIANDRDDRDDATDGGYGQGS